MFADPRSACYRYNDPYFKVAIFRKKVVASATSTLVLLSKKPKHKVIWSKNSILVFAVALDPGPFNSA